MCVLIRNSNCHPDLSPRTAKARIIVRFEALLRWNDPLLVQTALSKHMRNCSLKVRGLMASRYMPHIGMVALASQQYLAIALIYSAIPVILRGNGASLELVGLYGTVFFAFTVNFLWAPVVDRWSLNRLGLRRSWIVLTQIATTTVLAVMAFLNPKTDFVPVFLVSLALATVAATQRIATLGYIAEALGSGERPLGAALLGSGDGSSAT